MRPKTGDPLVDSDTGLPRTPVAWRHRELHLPQTNLMSQSYYQQGQQQQPIHQPLPSVISNGNHHHHHQYSNNHQHHPHQLHNDQLQHQLNSHIYHSQNNHQHHLQQQQQQHHHHHHPSSSNQRTSSPSVLTTSSDDREEVPMVRHHHHHHSSSSHRRHNGGSVYSATVDRRRSKHFNQSTIVPRSSMARGSIVSYGPGPMRNYQRTATLRSTRSFPGLVMTSVGTYDGEPCPVHGSNHHLHHHTPIVSPAAPVSHSLPMSPRHLSMSSSHHHPVIHPYEHATSSSLLAHPVHNNANQPMLTMKRFNSLSDLRRPSLTPLIAYPVNGSAIGLGPPPPPLPAPPQVGTMIPHSAAANSYDCLSKSMGSKLPLPTYVGTMFRNNNGSTSFIPSGAQIMIPGHGSAPLEAIKSHLAAANQVNSLMYDDTVCCKGHLIVLWIILTVVTIGVISGIILGVTAN